MMTWSEKAKSVRTSSKIIDTRAKNMAKIHYGNYNPLRDRDRIIAECENIIKDKI